MTSARKRPSPAVTLAGAALLAALAALVLSLTGVATGLPGKNRIDRNDLRKRVVKPINVQKNAIKGFQLAPNAVGGFHVKESTLGQVPSAAFAENADSAENGVKAEGRLIADGTTETILNLAQGAIRVTCDATPDLHYDNNSGSVALTFNDGGALSPVFVNVFDGNTLHVSDSGDEQHVDLAILTDNHVTFVDYYLERTGAPECIVIASLSEVPR